MPRGSEAPVRVLPPRFLRRERLLFDQVGVLIELEVRPATSAHAPIDASTRRARLARCALHAAFCRQHRNRRRRHRVDPAGPAAEGHRAARLGGSLLDSAGGVVVSAGPEAEPAGGRPSPWATRSGSRESIVRLTDRSGEWPVPFQRRRRGSAHEGRQAGQRLDPEQRARGSPPNGTRARWSAWRVTVGCG